MDRKHPDDVIPEAIMIAHCRELLDDEAEGLSDSEIDEIRRHTPDTLAHVMVEIFLEHRAAQE